MIDEAKRLVAALRARCAEQADCNACPIYEYCIHDGMHTMHNKAADLIESLAAELEKVKRERDAAVEDLRKVCKATEVCFCCESYDAAYVEYVSNNCMDCIKHCNWQWRGVREG